jgi:hypothetical protein
MSLIEGSCQEGDAAPRDSPAAWLSRVRDVQQSRIDPQQREVILRRANEQRSMNHVSLQSAAIQQRAQEVVFHCRRGAAPSMGHGEREEALAQLQHRTASYAAAWNDSAQLQEQMLQSRAEDFHTRQREARGYGGDADDDDETQDRAMVVGDMTVAPAAEEAAADSLTLLESLRVEPPTEEERCQKFTTYEIFSDAVTGLRVQLDEVVLSALRSLPVGDASDDVRRRIKKLDCQENTGVFDESRNWFVFDMAKQTIDNCSKIRQLSESISSKVKFAAENVQEDCPVCLEKFTAAGGLVSPKMLSCCHVVCDECWTNWTAVKEGRPYCPLCKHEEFVEFIFVRTA